MGIPENHPAILAAWQKGLIQTPAVAAPSPDRPVELAAASFTASLDGVEAVVPVVTASEANIPGWRGKSRRVHAARRAVSRLLGRHLRQLAVLAEHYHAGRPLDVVLTRLGGRRLDRLANLGAALKGVEDAVALMLGADDGSPLWRARAEQEPGGAVGVRVRITMGG